MHFKRFLYALALAGCALPAVHAQSLDNVFRAFSKCDASFFKAMKDEVQTIQGLAPLESKGDAMWFKVSDRKDEKKRAVALLGKPTIAGLPVVSYVENVVDLSGVGQFYFWGFSIKGSFSNVLEKLSVLDNSLFQGERFVKNARLHIRTELKPGVSVLLPINTTSELSETELVKRAFLIEPDDDDQNVMQVLCSLQGLVGADHLEALRPDIDTKDYPGKANALTFDATPPSNVLIKKLQDSIRKQPLFLPKFKKITVSYVTRNDKKPTINTYTHLGEGLLLVEEAYSMFTMRRLLVGDTSQVKFGSFNIQNLLESAGVAEDVSIVFATTLIKGQLAYKSEITRLDVYPRKNSAPSAKKTVCMTGDRLPASAIFKSLTGDAILLICNPENEFSAGLALIEDLGLTLWYELPNSKKEYKPIYTSITIER